jgi:glucose-1-phosphate thymidylyltransferase
LKEPYTIAIPMAGLGTRMRPHTWSKPKPLIHLAGKTVLDYVLEQFSSLPRFKDAHFVLILGPNQEEQVDEYIRENHADKHISYVIQHEMRGQSDALYLARDYLKGPMLMAFSDTLIETDLASLDDEEFDAVAWVKAVPDPRRFGVAEVDKDNQVKRLIEKPKDTNNNLAVVGFYYFRDGAALMDAIQEQVEKDVSLNGEYFLVDAINIMIQKGAKMRVQTVDVWLDAGKPDALLETNQFLLDNGQDNSESAARREGITVIPPVYIHPDADLKACVVGPYVSIGKDASIHEAIIKNSIVEQEAHISHMVLENSLIGRQAGVKGRSEVMNIGDNSWIEI